MLRTVERSKQQGFTIIELIMVLVLMAIMGLGIRSLFFSREGYSGFLAKDQFLVAALLAQEHALGVSALNNAVSLTVGVAGDEWYFRVSKSGSNVFEARQEHSGGALAVDGTTLSAGSSHTFTLDSRGNLTSGANHQIRFNSGHNYYICLSAAGYAWENSGACP